MAYAFTVKRPSKTKPAPSWQHATDIRLASEAREKEVSDAARRFRNAQ